MAGVMLTKPTLTLNQNIIAQAKRHASTHGKGLLEACV
jgi:hypothetical protein